MPIQVVRYLCQHCKSEYQDFQSAMNCEMLPIPSNPYPEGSVITFQNEESLFGSRYSYCTASGEVLYTHLTINKHTQSHVWVWIVKPTNGLMNCEHLVIEGTDEFGMCCLVSLAENKYQIGFAELLRMKHLNPY